MTPTSYEPRPFLRRIATGSFVAGLSLAVAGLILVLLSPFGETEFSFFGQDFKSNNVGIAAIFIGASLIVLNIRRVLKSHDIVIQSQIALQEGKKAQGEMRLSDMKVEPDRQRNACVVDFRVSNDGGSAVLVNAVKFELLDMVSVEIKGYLEFSHTYDLDLSSLEEIGDTVTADVSQEIQPGQSDRFGITIVASQMPPGVERGWRLLPTLMTNYGEVTGKQIEIWFPDEGQVKQPGYFDESKNLERFEKEMREKVDSPVMDEGTGKLEDQDRNTLLQRLISEPDLEQVAEHLDALSFSSREVAVGIVESEDFGMRVIQKINTERDLKKISLCLDAMCRISERGARAILGYKDFGIRVIPQKLNSEPDIEGIGSCIFVIAACCRDVGQAIVDIGGFDTERFLQKLNAEPEVGKIWNCLEKIVYFDRNFAKSIIESEHFDVENLIQKLNSEATIEKIDGCLAGISLVSEKVALDIRASLEPEIQRELSELDE